MADFRNIRRALEKRLATIQDSNGLPLVAWENVRFDPTNKTEFVRASIQVASQRPINVGANSEIENRGILLIECYERMNSATSAADVLADSVLSAFTYGLQLTEGSEIVRIRYAERAGAVQDEPWYFVPITIAWYSLV